MDRSWNKMNLTIRFFSSSSSSFSWCRCWCVWMRCLDDVNESQIPSLPLSHSLCTCDYAYVRVHNIFYIILDHLNVYAKMKVRNGCEKMCACVCYYEQVLTWAIIEMDKLRVILKEIEKKRIYVMKRNETKKTPSKRIEGITYNKKRTHKYPHKHHWKLHSFVTFVSGWSTSLVACVLGTRYVDFDRKTIIFCSRINGMSEHYYYTRMDARASVRARVSVRAVCIRDWRVGS